MCDTMSLVKNLKPDFVFEDERGMLAQLVSSGYTQVNAVFTKKGAVRGNFHYHKTTKECFFVLSGKIKVTLCLGEKTEKHIFKTGDMFLVKENVKHSFDYIEDTYLVVMYTDCVEMENGEKDIFVD